MTENLPINDLQIQDQGLVTAVGDGIVYAIGLENIEAGALVIIESTSNQQQYNGMVLNLELNQVAIVLFGSDQFIRPGDVIYRDAAIVTIGVGKNVLGRVNIV